MILVFDLDDTLYNEVTFVQSGFKAVAEFLCNAYGIAIQDSYSFMLEKLQGGRGRIFDDMLAHFGIYSKRMVQKCIGVYRSHQANIQLYPDAAQCLERLKNHSIYIVTDGHKGVQRNKLQALGLYDTVKFCYITHRYGVSHAKPSPYCFWKICEREKVDPQQVVYIGDNPHKDFVEIKRLGFKTVRIMRGNYKDVVKTQEFEADRQIQSLDELTEALLREIFSA